jgi:hypothetical protein
MSLKDDYSDTEDLEAKLKPKKQSPEVIKRKEFEKKVKSIEENKSEYKQSIAGLTKKFMSMMLDKTLQENKDIISSDIEKQTRDELIALSVKINNDENEQEGMGSSLINALLLNCLVMQRNKINKLEYALSELKKDLDSGKWK